MDRVNAADALIRDGELRAARRLLKEHLLAHPEDAGAHFLLGRTYLQDRPFRPLIAEGEYQAAAKWYAKNGANTIARFESGTYFAMMCEIESAKVYLRVTGEVMALGFPRANVQEYVEKGLEYIERARAINPEAEEIGQIEAGLLEVRQG